MNKRSWRISCVVLTATSLLGASACSSATDDTPSSEEDGASEQVQAEVGVEESAVFETPHGLETLRYQRLPDGTRMFQGDIVLPEEGPDYRSGAISSFGKLWPGGIVRYENTGLFNDARVVQAIAEWERRVPGLTFVGGATTGNRIRFVTGTECSSAFGMSGGAQTLKLAPTCDQQGTIHEIGHAIGLFHEQSRTDRDSFVEINWGCIGSGMSSQFDKFSSSNWNLGTYDYGSVMQYRSDAFLNQSKAGCTWTIRAKNGAALGNTSISNGDAAGVQALYQTWSARPAVDYDSDRRADLAVWRPRDPSANFSGVWYVARSSDGAVNTQQVGRPGDVPVPGDYNGNGVMDYAVWRPSDGVWEVAVDGALWNPGSFLRNWGTRGDIPVPADYDGDKKTDLAVWRPSEGTWYVILSSTNQEWNTQLGQTGDVPVPRDYDRDGRADRAVWNPSSGVWISVGSSAGSAFVQWGAPGDIPVPGDYDGDGWIDMAVWRRSDLKWHVRGGGDPVEWGERGDTPVPGDYDGDGRDDRAIWRPRDGTFWILNSSGGWRAPAWGQIGDAPVQ